MFLAKVTTEGEIILILILKFVLRVLKIMCKLNSLYVFEMKALYSIESIVLERVKAKSMSPYCRWWVSEESLEAV